MDPFVGRVEGLQNLPKRSPVIFCANHASYIDHYIIGGLIENYIEEDLYFVAKKEHFSNFFTKKWHASLKAIPIDRNSSADIALKNVIEILKKGKTVLIYPEGTRSTTGRIQKGKTGVAVLALKAKVPVIPIGIINTHKILPKGSIIPRFNVKAEIKIGKPLTFNQYYDTAISYDVLKHITTNIMSSIANLCKMEYHY